jgi:DNA-binding transcriptional regulator PaaX
MVDLNQHYCHRFSLLSFYLSRDGDLVTQKELDDWAKEFSYELHRVKLLNQALIKEGFVKSRKATGASSYYWLTSPEDLKDKLERARELYEQRLS